MTDGRDLRHAHTGDDARGADRARADTHLHAISTVVHEGTGRIGGGDIAPHDINPRKVAFHPAHPIEHALRMAVSRVDHDEINPGFHQQRGTLFGALTHANGRPDTQLAIGILAGLRMLARLEDVFHGDETAQFERLVHDQHALESVLVQQRHRLFEARPLAHRDELVALGHDFTHPHVKSRLEAQVAVGDDTNHLAALHHRQSRDAVLGSETLEISHGEIR